VPPTAGERFRNTRQQRATVTVPAGLRLATRQADASEATSKVPCVTTVKSRKSHTGNPKLHEFTLAAARVRLLSTKVTREPREPRIISIESRVIK